MAAAAMAADVTHRSRSAPPHRSAPGSDEREHARRRDPSRRPWWAVMALLVSLTRCTHAFTLPDGTALHRPGTDSPGTPPPPAGKHARRAGVAADSSRTYAAGNCPLEPPRGRAALRHPRGKWGSKRQRCEAGDVARSRRSRRSGRERIQQVVVGSQGAGRSWHWACGPRRRAAVASSYEGGFVM